ncbi:MAG: leucyl aminopeptidase [Bacteroidales bacterium]|nr:leucyl aminopeptidase [Bacteroidales bacterium]
MELVNLKAIAPSSVRVILIDSQTELDVFNLNAGQTDYLTSIISNQNSPGAIRICPVNLYPDWLVFVFPDPEKKDASLTESYRQDGVEIQKWVNSNRLNDVILENHSQLPDRLFMTAEGIILSNYQFLPYFSEADKKRNSLSRMAVSTDQQERLRELEVLTEAVYKTRDLVNEPLSSLNAVKFADEIEKMAFKLGIGVEVMDKNQIEAMGMGGLLSVNLGSIDPPRFCVLDYNPENPLNEKPLVLVGKGIVYDTGGLSLKPTPNSMDHMKSDMAGAAAVTGVMYALAALNWPVRVVALIPITDNRPDGNAYVPGDVIRMHSGLSVEVLNTDAEGRMILADALSYAKKYDPELVIDMATLTGSAVMTVGSIGTVVMGTADEKIMKTLSESGHETFERTVELPLWDEYGKLMESEIADLKNIGGRDAGAITAGKFLQRFTDYPWIHMDIAGPAFLFAKEGYRGVGGTGTGVRLLIEFIKRQYLSVQ